MDDEGTAVNGAGTTTVHDVHMRGLSEKHIEKDIGSSMSSRMYVAPEVYELERRVIFSKRWFLVSHKARYRNVGDFVLYEMAGFSFVVVRNKEQRLVRFHNICRYDPRYLVKDVTGSLWRAQSYCLADTVLSQWCRRVRVLLRHSRANIMAGRIAWMESLRRRRGLIQALCRHLISLRGLSVLSMFMWIGMALSM